MIYQIAYRRSTVRSVHLKNAELEASSFPITANISLPLIKREKEKVFYDMSDAFRVHEGVVSGLTCLLKPDYADSIIFRFWAFNIYLPNVYKNVTSITESYHNHISFGSKHFLYALRQL